ncbi:MAG TPA: hypothetical protein VN151_00120 [Terracidiphilus sp.]|nr:hypothetical protein [Terracidiphilus sp.]
MELKPAQQKSRRTLMRLKGRSVFPRTRGLAPILDFAITAVIELCRGAGDNPDVPESLRANYFNTIHGLAVTGARQLPDEVAPDTVRAILAIIALDKGLRTQAHFLLDFTEDELLELDPER